MMNHNFKISINVLRVLKLTTTKTKPYLCCIVLLPENFCGFQITISLKEVNLCSVDKNLVV